MKSFAAMPKTDISVEDGEVVITQCTSSYQIYTIRLPIQLVPDLVYAIHQEARASITTEPTSYEKAILDSIVNSAL